jgi:hypothetical protein
MAQAIPFESLHLNCRQSVYRNRDERNLNVLFMHDANLPETIGVARFQNDTQAGLITTPTPCANADNVMIERPQAPAPNSQRLRMFQRKPNPV